MINSTLIKLLSRLSENDFKKLGKFLTSPYFNTNSKVIELYKLLKKFHPDFASLEVSKENFFKSLYDGQPYVEGTMAYLVSEFETLTEKFLSLENLNPVFLDISLLKKLNEYRLDKHFEKVYKVVSKKVSRINDESNILKFMLAQVNLNNVSAKHETKTKKDLYRKEWFQPIEELVKLFFRNIVRSIELFSNYSLTTNDKLSIPYLKEITMIVENDQKLRDDFEIKMLMDQVRMILYKDEECYHRIKHLLKTNSRRLDNMQINETLINLQVFCVYQVTMGRDFVEEEFDVVMLYEKFNRERLKKRTLIDFYFQAFALALALGKYEWLASFHKKYSKSLEPQFQNNAVHYGNAQLYYVNGQFEKALKEISQIKNYAFVHYKPAVKILQLRIYYELGFISEADDLVNTFSQFLRNDKLIPGSIKKTYINFANLYKKLLTVRFTNDIKRIDNLKFEMSRKKDFVVAKKWFSSQLDSIEKEITGKKVKSAS